MKRLLSVLLILTFSMLLVMGCGSKTATNEPTKPQEQPKKKLKVACLMSGPISDNGWNATAYKGLKDVEAKMGAEIAYSESVQQSDYEEVFRNYANQGFDVVLAHGYEFSDAAKKVSLEFPKVKFIVTSTDISQAPNVASLNIAPGERGFLAGIVAGLVTKTNVVGVVGGMDIPPISHAMVGFEKGAKYVNPSVKVIKTMTGSFDDAGKAKETALAMIESKADIVYGMAAQSSLGALDACKSKGVLAIMSGDDANSIAPDTVLVSTIDNIGNAFINVIQLGLDGKFEPKSYNLGRKEEACYLSSFHGFEQKLSKETLDKIKQIDDDLKSGKLEYSKLP
jgi:basic membrane protein A